MPQPGRRRIIVVRPIFHDHLIVHPTRLPRMRHPFYLKSQNDLDSSNVFHAILKTLFLPPPSLPTPSPPPSSALVKQAHAMITSA
jgi:hypothetical protein